MCLVVSIRTHNDVHFTVFINIASTQWVKWTSTPLNFVKCSMINAAPALIIDCKLPIDRTDGTAFISSPMGWRMNPGQFYADGLPREYFHTGIDIAAPRLTPVRAVLPGVVRFAGTHKDLGNTVGIQHSDNSVAWYSHLALISVHLNDEIPLGVVVGAVGSTGQSTGDHLDFMLRDVNNKPMTIRATTCYSNLRSKLLKGHIHYEPHRISSQN